MVGPSTLEKSSQGRHPSYSFRVFIWDKGADLKATTPRATQESCGESPGVAVGPLKPVGPL